MTVQRLKNKHKRERRNRRVNMVKNVILAIVGIAVMAGFVELGLRAWDKEIEINTNNSIEWQTTYSR